MCAFPYHYHFNKWSVPICVSFSLISNFKIQIRVCVSNSISTPSLGWAQTSEKNQNKTPCRLCSTRIRIASIHMAHSSAPQLKLTRNYSWTVRQTERIVDRPFVALNLHLFSVVHRAGILFSLVIYILHEINLIINTIASGWPYYILAVSTSSQGILSDYFRCEYTYCPYHCVIGRFSLLTLRYIVWLERFNTIVRRRSEFKRGYPTRLRPYMKCT